jgi:MFS family permease
MSAEQPPSLFQSRDFICVLFARVFAMLAVEMVNVAVGWKVYALTHSPLALGLIGLAQFSTVLPLTFVTGPVADHLDRRVVIQCSYGAAAVCVALLLLLSLVHHTAAWPIFVLMAALVGARSFSFPALQSLLPNIVPLPQFSSAIAYVSSANKIATVTGPAIGGFLYAVGEPVVFVAAMLCFIGAGISAALVRPLPHMSKRQPPLTLAAAFLGLRFVVAHRILRGIATLDLFATLLGGVTAMLPIYARDIFHAGPQGLGLLRCAPAIGAGLVAIYLARRPLQHNAGRTMLTCVAVFGVATAAFGVSTRLPIAMAALTVLGAADMCSVFVRQTMLQIGTPDALRGRVSAVNVLFVSSSNQLGQVESGTAAALLGTVPSVVFGGIGSIVVAALWAWLFPELRRIDLSPQGMTNAAEEANNLIDLPAA